MVAIIAPLGHRMFSTLSSASQALKFCVVGTGPAGFYTADRLLKKLGANVQVDLVDRLPSPFGLVRSGVAPDHQDTKNVINQFTAMGGDPRVSYFGNVTLGRDVSLRELRDLYHGVVLAYGAETDRQLGMPGEDAKNVFSAREFVWWYNGHPDAADLPVDLTRVKAAAVCGIGNVALDCARLLLKGRPALASTDIAAHALDALDAPLAAGHAAAGAPLRSVHLVARRGPVQAACTPKELRELVGETKGLAVHAPEPQMAVSEADGAEMASKRVKRRVYDVIKQAARTRPAPADGTPSKHLHFDFYRQPREVVVGADGYVEGLVVEKTELRAEPGKPAVAVGTGQLETIPCQLVLVSIGYRSLPVEGAPFDAKRGVIPNKEGRVLQGTSPQAPGADVDAVDPGLYVCGWLKRGPTGIIGTNALDADETVASICADVTAGGVGRGDVRGAEGLRALLRGKGVQAVDFPGWLCVDEAEVAAGKAAGKVREKMVRVSDMLKVAAQ